MDKKLMLGAEEIKAKIQEVYAAGFTGNPLVMGQLANLPMDAEMPLPEIVNKVCRVVRADKGEDVYYFATTIDGKTVYTISSGSITQANVSITAQSTLSWNSYNAPVDYVYLEELMTAKYDPIARAVKAQNEGLNRKEIKDVLDLAIAAASGASQAYTLDSGDTTFDFPKAEEMVRGLNKYATKFILVAGNTVASDIALMDYTADKQREVKLSALGIQEVLTVPTFQYTHSGTQTCLSATVAVLVGINGTEDGMPILFARRKAQDVFSGNGGDKERVAFVAGPRTQVGSNAKWAYEVGVMEQYGAVVTNPYAVASFTRS
jgi:hypothetical protein